MCVQMEITLRNNEGKVVSHIVGMFNNAVKYLCLWNKTNLYI